jgi:hypothetical protein
MAKQMTDSNTPTNEQIARRAYEIFMERGQPEGQDLAHWLEAERQLRAAGQGSRAAQAVNTQVSTTQMRPTQPAAPSNGRGNGRSQTRATARK